MKGMPRNRKRTSAQPSGKNFARKSRSSAFFFSASARPGCRQETIEQGMTLRLAHSDRFFANPSQQWISASHAGFDRATRQRAGHGLKIPDALHLAAVPKTGSQKFRTDGHHLETATARRIRFTAFN